MDYTCCICGKRFHGWGNNPWPVRENGQCCDACNSTVVVPARIEGMILARAEKRDIAEHADELKEDLSGIPEDNDGGEPRKIVRRTNKKGK